MTADEWIDFTTRNLTGAEKQRQNSVNLRQICEGILQSSYNDLCRQKECTDNAFEYRINETRDTKAKIEEHLNKVRRVRVLNSARACDE